MTANHSTNTVLLFEHFATLATAPDGIARLRELILQLAVQGKLGTQDAGDEPASVLLEKIKKEKERLVKSGEIKSDGKYEPIKEDEISFPIPKTWQWIRLGELTQKIGSGSTPKGGRAVYQENGIKFIRSQNVWNDGLYLEGIARISNEIHQTMNFTVVQPRDILLNITGASIGRSCIVPDNFDEGNVNQHVSIIRTVDKKIRSYLHYCIISPYFQNRIMDVQVGMSREGLSKKVLKDLLIPFPPLAEQERIIAKVDRLMALCDELEARQQQERAGRLRLGTASLTGLQNAEGPEEFGRHWAQVCDAFDLILDCPENVAVLREAVFHLAVHGRLMQQMSQDEPAEKLLERIRKEKERLVKEGEIKREKPLEPVLDAEPPFAIPDSWKWVRINDAAKIVEYGTSEKAMPSTTAYGKNSVPVFRMNNIQNGKVIHENLKYLPNSMEELPRLYLQNNDILINRTNSYELVGKAGIFKGEDDQYTFASYLIRISFFPQLVNPDFVNITLNASYFRTSQIEPQVTQQCGQANFSGSKIKNALIPLPPLAEQHRIVAKVDALMALCDALESRLKERAGVQARLAGAVVKLVAG
ncbi:MAG: restriction endonuclease subunit S [Methanoregula sp.]|nr:restriction endonuclease subunit S [Methanoregula sp.]